MSGNLIHRDDLQKYSTGQILLALQTRLAELSATLQDKSKHSIMGIDNLETLANIQKVALELGKILILLRKDGNVEEAVERIARMTKETLHESTTEALDSTDYFLSEAKLNALKQELLDQVLKVRISKISWYKW